MKLEIHLLLLIVICFDWVACRKHVLPLINSDSPPSNEDVEKLLLGATILRTNVLCALGQLLQNPALRLNSRQWQALQDIKEGLRSGEIDTVDCVADIQETLTLDNQVQFRTLLSRLDKTAPFRYYEQIQLILRDIGDDTWFRVISQLKFKLFAKIPSFPHSSKSFRWFSKLSDSTRRSASPLDKRSKFYKAIMEQFKKGTLVLSVRTFAYILLNLHCHGIPPEVNEIRKYVAQLLMKNEKQLSDVVQETEPYDSLHGMVKTYLNKIVNSGRILDSRCSMYLSQLIPYIEEDGIMVSMCDKLGLESRSLDTSQLLPDTSLKYPEDITQALEAVREGIETRKIPLSVHEVGLVYAENTNRDDAMLSVFQKMILAIPDFNELKPYLKSILRYLRMRINRSKGIVHVPKTPTDIVSLLDSFDSFDLSGDIMRVKDTIGAIVSSKEIDWVKSLKMFTFEQYGSPRSLVLDILKWVLLHEPNLFSPAEEALVDGFVKGFISSTSETVPKDEFNQAHQLPSSEKNPSVCMAKCLPPTSRMDQSLQDILTETEELFDTTLIPVELTNGTHLPKTWTIGDSNVLKLEIVDKSVTKTVRVDPQILLSPLDNQIAEDNRRYLENFFSGDEAWKMLKDFNYKAFSNRRQLLREILAYLRRNYKNNDRLCQAIDETIDSISVKGVGEEGYDVTTIYLNTRFKKPSENLTSMFLSIDQSNLPLRDQLILEKILQHFRTASVPKPGRRTLILDITALILLHHIITRENPHLVASHIPIIGRRFKQVDIPIPIIGAHFRGEHHHKSFAKAILRRLKQVILEKRRQKETPIDYISPFHIISRLRNHTHIIEGKIQFGLLFGIKNELEFKTQHGSSEEKPPRKGLLWNRRGTTKAPPTTTQPPVIEPEVDSIDEREIPNIDRIVATVDLATVFQVIHLEKLPAKIRKQVEELYIWISKRTRLVTTLIEKIDLTVHNTRSKFLKALLDLLVSSPEVEPSIKQIITTLYVHIKFDEEGAAPLDITIGELKPPQIAINVSGLFEPVRETYAGPEVRDAKQKIIIYIESNPYVLSTFTSTHYFLIYKTSGVFLENFLTYLWENEDTPEDIKVYITKIIPQIDIQNSGQLPVVLFIDNTIEPVESGC